MATTELKAVDAVLSDGQPYRIPYWSIDSGRPGPCVLVTCALHATELQGAEMVRRFLPTVSQQILRGSCLLVPFANPMAVRKRQPHIDFQHDRYYGGDAVDNVNLTWPGAPDGSSAQRLSHALFHSVVVRATHLIDIHCWQHVRAATGLTRTGRQDCIGLVNAAGLPFGRHSEWRPEVTQRPALPCTLSSYFLDTGRVGVAIEYSGQYGFWHDQLDLGERVLRNAFRYWEMLSGDLETSGHPTVWLNDSKELKVVAPVSGVFVPEPIELGDWVTENDLLGHVLGLDDLGAGEVRAPGDGYLFRLGPTHDVNWEQTRMFMHPYVEERQEIVTLVQPESRQPS